MVLTDANEATEPRTRKVSSVRAGRWGLFSRRGDGGNVPFALLGGRESQEGGVASSLASAGGSPERPYKARGQTTRGFHACKRLTPQARDGGGLGMTGPQFPGLSQEVHDRTTRSNHVQHVTHREQARSCKRWGRLLPPGPTFTDR